MSAWLILVDNAKDVPADATAHTVMSTRDYLSRAQRLRGTRPNIINLARSFAYQGRGYYSSLLAEARRHRVLPRIETILELSRKDLYAHALPELEEALNKALRKGAGEDGSTNLLFCFGQSAEPGFSPFGRLLFDWFRAPVLSVRLDRGEWTRITRIRLVPFNEVKGEARDFFFSALERHTRTTWREAKVRDTARYSLAVLHDPQEALPPSSVASLKYFTRIASRMDMEVVPITRKDLPRLAEYDALFIRETTNIDHHTFRFARRATQEGMPVIDDPGSMIRCTNKIYLGERLTGAGLPVPRTFIIQKSDDFDAAAEACGYPVVLKVPDSSFSRGVKKADDRAALAKIVAAMLEESDLVIAQEFMPTEFDWRVGVLDGEPLFVCQYAMARKHWQIIRHEGVKRPVEGKVVTMPLTQAPAEVLDIGARAARLIGRGLYGVDLKQTAAGVFVVEINDNPNIDHGYEDAAEGDIVWRRLVTWFIDRIERR
jgi:glutathione synthase/RimK-type ligase-like ATP-grasp enzyme